MSIGNYDPVLNMGEISTLALNAPGHASLRTTVPMNIIRQWGLEAGDKLEWSWEARDNEMIVVVRRVQKSSLKKRK
jgi:hypothetical protein